MEIAYINERIDRKLRASTTVFCATKEKITEALEAAGMRVDIRGEKLSPRDFVLLADLLNR